MGFHCSLAIWKINASCTHRVLDRLKTDYGLVGSGRFYSEIIVRMHAKEDRRVRCMYFVCPYFGLN